MNWNCTSERLPLLILSNNQKFRYHSCHRDTECIAYQYTAYERENCVSIRSNTTEEGTVFMTDRQRRLYKKGWLTY